MFRCLLSLIDAARHHARRRRWNDEQATGRRAEDLAHRYLERHGMTVVGRNYRPPSGHGEIDLVAWDGGVLVFVEVKSRHSAGCGAPDRNIDEHKRTSLRHAARDYVRRSGASWDSIRFDVVTVLLANPPVISHSRDAFSLIRTL